MADPDAITRSVDDDPPLAGATTALEAARRNGELEGWRRDGVVPARVLPETFPFA